MPHIHLQNHSFIFININMVDSTSTKDIENVPFSNNIIAVLTDKVSDGTT